MGQNTYIVGRLYRYKSALVKHEWNKKEYVCVSVSDTQVVFAITPRRPDNLQTHAYTLSSAPNHWYYSPENKKIKSCIWK